MEIRMPRPEKFECPQKWRPWAPAQKCSLNSENNTLINMALEHLGQRNVLSWKATNIVRSCDERPHKLVSKCILMISRLLFYSDCVLIFQTHILLNCTADKFLVEYSWSILGPLAFSVLLFWHAIGGRDSLNRGRESLNNARFMKRRM